MIHILKQLYGRVRLNHYKDKKQGRLENEVQHHLLTMHSICTEKFLNLLHQSDTVQAERKREYNTWYIKYSSTLRWENTYRSNSDNVSRSSNFRTLVLTFSRIWSAYIRYLNLRLKFGYYFSLSKDRQCIQ